MTQRQIVHAPGTLPRCVRCECQPKHFEDQRAVRCGGGHFFECCRCDNRTGRHATENLALADWCQRNGYAVRQPGARVSHLSQRGRA